jgi:hypothetical protein
MSGITHITVGGHRIEIGDSKFECDDMEAFRKSQAKKEITERVEKARERFYESMIEIQLDCWKSGHEYIDPPFHGNKVCKYCGKMLD